MDPEPGVDNIPLLDDPGTLLATKPQISDMELALELGGLYAPCHSCAHVVGH